jgi:hypothetical protein
MTSPDPEFGSAECPTIDLTSFDAASWEQAKAAREKGQKPANSPRAVPVADLPLIPQKREWLHGTDLMRGAVSMLVAPGARAKTTWLLTCALACASGRSLLGATVFGGPLRVLYLSAEDARNEIALRLRAAMGHHSLSNADVPGLYVIGADQWGLPLLQAAGGPPAIHPAGWNALTAELDRINADVLIIDPLINVMGGVNVNENSGAGLLMGRLTNLAANRRIAVMIAHHASKGRDPKLAESAMGAATLTNLCRIVLAIEPIDPQDAGRVGLPAWKVASVYRVFGTKQNYRAPDKDDRMFRLRTAQIQNQQPPTYPHGDQVVVIEEFHPGSSGPAFPPHLIRDVLFAIDTADPPLSSSKIARTRYAVPLIASAMSPHRGRADDMEAKSVLDHLIRTGLVQIQDVKIPRNGSRSDVRQGLVLTPAGKAAMQEVADGSPAIPAEAPHCPLRE